MATFRVDDVVPAADPLPTVPVADRFEDALTVGVDPAMPVLEPDGVHPLLSAVGRAFAEHRPLVLSPDAVWLTILQGVAQHVRLNAEELRPRLVSHSGKKRLTVKVQGPMPQDPGSWQHAAELWGKLLANEVSDTDLFECDFTTSTDVEKMAGRVVMFDAYSPYFSLWMMCVCGIPSITLTGTVEDWQKIRTRVDRLTTFGLDDWCRSLAPIADHFVRAAAGDADTAFWQRIYNPVDAYGGKVITGWIARLYPYLRIGERADHPNPLLELPIGEPRDVTVKGMFYKGAGITSREVPATLSQARVNVNDQVTGDNRAVALNAGLVGVAQDDDGALRPVAGWYLAPAPPEIGDVIDRIESEHEVTPPSEPGWVDGPADVIALYRRIGSASLFNGSWRLRPADDRPLIDRGRHQFPIMTLFDLPGGRIIGAVIGPLLDTVHWVACRVETVVDDRPLAGELRLADAPADVPVYGTSLAFLLDAALDSGGDISHLETGRLDQLDRATD